MKTCRKCGETKPLDEFHRRKSSRDGRQACCKTCRRAQQSEYDARPEVRAHRAEYRGRTDVKARMAEYNAEYFAANREAILERQAEYYARPEVKARKAEYYAGNPHTSWESGYRRRAKKFGFEPVIESFAKDDLIAKYGNECWHCGGPFEELDHFPLAVVHGGPHTIENCKPSCLTCNRAGGNVRRTNTTTEKSN